MKKQSARQRVFYSMWYIPAMKPLLWAGSSKKDLLAMPSAIQGDFGYALHVAQTGGRHENAKPLQGFGGAGVLEAVESDEGGTYRAVYTVRFVEAVVVLHCFQKKSKHGAATPKADMDLILSRLKAAQTLIQELRDANIEKIRG